MRTGLGPEDAIRRPLSLLFVACTVTRGLRGVGHKQQEPGRSNSKHNLFYAPPMLNILRLALVGLERGGF